MTIPTRGLPRPRRSETGFTLLELLAAMTVLAVLTALLSGGLGFGTRVWEREKDRLQEWAELQSVQEAIRRMLTQALPVAGGNVGDDQGAFSGTATSVRFVGPAPALSAVGGLYQYELLTRVGPGGLDLVLEWRLRSPSGTRVPPRGGRREARPDPARPEEPKQVVLVERLGDVSFSYFGAGEEGSAPLWRDRWDNAERPPTLVRLAVGFPPQDPRVWPELVVAPVIAGGAGG